jgi:Yip1 domain
MISADTSSPGGIRLFAYRLVRSARFDGATFRSLREDNGATRQSVVALALAGLSVGLGFSASIGANLYGVLLGGAVGIGLGLLVGFLWLSLTYVVVTRLFKSPSSYWSLGRPIFFASSPALLLLFMLIAGSDIASIIYDVGLVWVAVLTVFAIRNAVGFDYQKSFLTFIIVAFILLVGYGLATSI